MSRTSTGSGWLLLVRWSVRDLRARWLQVAAIALVIALGTGSYAGLSNVTEWRRMSTDAGLEDLGMYDLRVRLAEGSAVQQGKLAAAVAGLEGLDHTEERLLVDVQVDASTADEAILVPGTIYGVAVGDGHPAVSGFSVPLGRNLAASDRGQPVVLLEHHFAKYYSLPAEGDLEISGGQRLSYVGQTLTPEFFIVTTERGGFLAEANYAALFTSLETAQSLSGKSGEVNDLVLTLTGEPDREAAKAKLADILATQLPGVGTTIMTREEDPSFALNDADIKGDQQVYVIFALLMFAGAVVAAFNLIARVVESQRREIGLEMVFGVSPWRIAIRPMLVAAEIAFLGVVFGIAVGMGIGALMSATLRDLQPLPEWQTPFLPRVFILVGIAGFFVPFLATSWPVWRAVRVPPVQAIQAGYRSVRSGGLAPVLSKLRLPGNTFVQMPLRNVVRTPRRTLLTSVGIAAALAALVAFVGLIDSFLGTIDAAEAEVLSQSPGRLEVTLDRPYAVDGAEVAAISGSAKVTGAETKLRLEGLAMNDGEEVGLQIELLALDSPTWVPRLSKGELDRSTPGIYLSELAAKNLGVDAGDSVLLRHPRLTEAGAFELVDTEMRVLGLHPHPYRFIAYMDINQAALFDLAGTTNLVQVLPAEGASPADVKRDLFPLTGVTAVQGVDELTKAIDDIMSDFVIVLRVIEGVMLLLALLIAFNSASINMDERAREHATMFAMGVPVRTVMRMAFVENVILGVIATAMGIGFGWLLLRAIIAIRIPTTLPEISVPAVIAPSTLIVTVVLGVLAVGFAPLLTWRRLRRMNVPSTLKVFD